MLYQAISKRELEIVMTDFQVAELKDVLSRQHVKRFIRKNAARKLIEQIDKVAIVLQDFTVPNLSPDPSDNQILAAAINGNADLVVSGDKKHMLALNEVDGIPIVTARRAVKLLSSTLT